MYLLDNNVWVALALDAHVHHLKAKTWLDLQTVPNTCCFCRVTQLGFLRLVSTLAIAKTQTQSLDGAWDLYDLFLSDPRVAFVREPSGLDVAWRLYAKGNQPAYKVWNDSYLATFAFVKQWTVVTFDRGFQAYSGLSTIILS